MQLLKGMAVSTVPGSVPQVLDQHLGLKLLEPDCWQIEFLQGGLRSLRSAARRHLVSLVSHPPV